MYKIKMNRNQLKYMLIIAMIIDHIAWSFVPTLSVLGQCMHFIGRLTGPGMALLLAEGYQYTRNKTKYALRLFIFAMISWIPYSLHSYHTWPYVDMCMFGMIWTLFIAFITIWMWDKLKVHVAIKVFLVMACVAISFFGDWPALGVLWALFAYIYRDDHKKKWISYGVITVVDVVGTMIMNGSVIRSLFQLGAIMVPFVFIYFYNGKLGSKALFHKWFFYIFYPAHLLILYFICGA